MPTIKLDTKNNLSRHGKVHLQKLALNQLTRIAHITTQSLEASNDITLHFADF